MPLGECVVCNRIPAKTVFAFGHMLQKYVQGQVDRQTIHKICVEAVAYINYVDKKNRVFFCGQKKFSVLSGLFYLLYLKHGLRLTQRNIAYCVSDYLKEQEGKEFNHEIAVRTHYKRWKAILEKENILSKISPFSY